MTYFNLAKQNRLMYWLIKWKLDLFYNSIWSLSIGMAIHKETLKAKEMV